MDIAPELFEKVQKEYQNRIKNSRKIRNLTKLVEQGKADYKDMDELAVEMGDSLAKAYKEITADELPDSRMYYNIADRVVRPTMEELHHNVVSNAEKVQTALNKKAGLGLMAVVPSVDENRIQGILDRVSSADNYTDVAWLLEEPIRNFAQNSVDETVRKNAQLHLDVGLNPKIIRTAEEPQTKYYVKGKRRYSYQVPCKWCAALEGEYDYYKVKNTGNDVFRRHEGCRCVVTYNPEGGKRQNVWDKKWLDLNTEQVNERIAEAKRIEAEANANAGRSERIAQAEAITTGFKAAQTIEQAEEYAKQFFDSSFMDKTFKGVASYKGISLEYANEINRTLGRLYKENPYLKPLSGVKAVTSKYKANGRAAFSGGADALMSYDPIQGGVYLNKEVLKNSKTFEKTIEAEKKAFQTVRENLNLLTGNDRKIAEKYLASGRSLVGGDNVGDLFTHEVGHHAQWTKLTPAQVNELSERMGDYAQGLSGYAQSSNSEYLAESFVAYQKGQYAKLDPKYIEYIRAN